MTLPSRRAPRRGRLRSVIPERFPLKGPAEGHAASEARATVGKTLLEVGAGS